MTTSVTRSCFTKQHQNCKTKTAVCKTKTKTGFLVSDRSCPKTNGLRPHHCQTLPHFVNIPHRLVAALCFIFRGQLEWSQVCSTATNLVKWVSHCRQLDRPMSWKRNNSHEIIWRRVTATVVTVRSHRRRLSVFIGVYRETVSCPDEHRIWADFVISTGSVDLDAILHDKRRWTRMNADFIPDALRLTAIYNDRNQFRPDILGF